jgi:hypothetical protein
MRQLKCLNARHCNFQSRKFSAVASIVKPRHFIALVPSKEVLTFLNELQEKLRKNEFYSSQLRWTPIENLHFTLKYFGDCIEFRMSLNPNLINLLSRSFAVADN